MTLLEVEVTKAISVADDLISGRFETPSGSNQEPVTLRRRIFEVCAMIFQL